MSLSDDIKAAVTSELAKPDARTAIENLEGLALNAIFRVINSLVPGFVLTIAGGVINAIEQKGIDAVKGFTDHELLHLAGGGISLIKEYPTPNSDSIHTKADLPAEMKADLGIKG